jgi:hypothetical protein
MLRAIGLVGSEQAKFTEVTERVARQLCRELIQRSGAEYVVSGACHLGGVDIYAVEEARKLGFDDAHIIEHKPAVLEWSRGYMPRNVKIACDSSEVYCITVTELPQGYTGMRFKLCYHCKTSSHVKSGGCWTVKQAKAYGKQVGIYAITPDGNVQVEL